MRNEEMTLERRRYSEGMRKQALLLLAQGRSQAVVARQLNIPNQTVSNWWRKRDQVPPKGKVLREVSEQEALLSQLRRELAQSKLEIEILKKASAYFAKQLT
jgi:transposase